MVYDVEICSKDGSLVYRDYKAINIIGVVKVAGPGTNFTGDSHLIDASIDGINPNPNMPQNLLMFRMAEKISAIVVHEKVKNLIESRKFSSIEFTKLEVFFGI